MSAASSSLFFPVDGGLQNPVFHFFFSLPAVNVGFLEFARQNGTWHKWTIDQ